MNTPFQPTPLSPAQVAAIEAWNQRNQAVVEFNRRRPLRELWRERRWGERREGASA